MVYPKFLLIFMLPPAHKCKCERAGQDLKSSLLPSWEHQCKLPGKLRDFYKQNWEKYLFLWLNLPILTQNT